MTRPQQRTASAPPLAPATPHPNGGPGQPDTGHAPGPNRYRTLLGAARQRADRAARARRRRRTITRRLIWLAVALVTAAIAIGVALRVTPLQTVTVAGQVIKVGTTAPSLSLSGPGEVDLFGQSLPTHVQFLGPVRPRLQLTQITINSELTNFVQGAGPAGAERILGDRLASGWIHYFAWETAITGLGALVLLGALAGWRRLPHRTTVKLLAGGLVLTEAINLGRDHAHRLHRAGHAAAGPVAEPAGRQRAARPPTPGQAVPMPPGVRLVVIGDSTAAGAGLPRLPSVLAADQPVRAQHRLLRRGPGPRPTAGR